MIQEFLNDGVARVALYAGQILKATAGDADSRVTLGFGGGPAALAFAQQQAGFGSAVSVGPFAQRVEVLVGSVGRCYYQILMSDSLPSAAALAVAPTTLAPTITSALTVGTLLAYAQGAVSGTPAPAVTFALTIGGSARSLPYTLVSGDAGQAVVLTQTATNSAGSASAAATGTVAALPVLTLGGTVPTTGTVGTAYSGTLSASNGSAPYTYSMSAGSLPAGVSLNASTGAITGTPTAAASGSITFMVTDSVGATATLARTITVSAPAADTRPRFFVAPANAYSTGTQAYLDGATVLTGSANGGTTGSFSLTTTTGNYGWVAFAVAADATSKTVTFSDASNGNLTGGWNGAGLPGIQSAQGPVADVSTVIVTASNGQKWALFRQAYPNSNPTANNWTTA
jgi:hypothetical protein